MDGSRVVSQTAKEMTEKDRFCTFLHVQKSSVLSVSKQYVNRTSRMNTCFLTMADLFSEWHRSILHRVKESTAANYAMKADKHILPAFGGLHVGDITANHIYRETVGRFFAPIYCRHGNFDEISVQIRRANLSDC